MIVSFDALKAELWTIELLAEDQVQEEAQISA